MSLLTIIAIVAGAVAVAVVAMFVIRSRARDERFFHEIERGSGILAFIGTAFAVLLAFVVLEAFDSFNDARQGAEQEAIAVLELSRTAESFSPRERDEIQADLTCYGRAVVHQEWAVMESEGSQSDTLESWAERLQETEQGVQVRTPLQEATILQLLQEDDNRIEGRRLRLAEAVREVPGPVWFILVLGAVLTIGWALLFHDRRERFLVQAALAGAVTALVVAGLLLVWFLDHPYSGSGGITPHEMERTLELMERENGPLSVPCNEVGEPVEPGRRA